MRACVIMVGASCVWKLHRFDLVSRKGGVEE